MCSGPARSWKCIVPNVTRACVSCQSRHVSYACVCKHVHARSAAPTLPADPRASARHQHASHSAWPSCATTPPHQVSRRRHSCTPKAHARAHRPVHTGPSGAARTREPLEVRKQRRRPASVRADHVAERKRAHERSTAARAGHNHVAAPHALHTHRAGRTLRLHRVGTHARTHARIHAHTRTQTRTTSIARSTSPKGESGVRVTPAPSALPAAAAAGRSCTVAWLRGEGHRASHETVQEHGTLRSGA